LVSNSSLVKLKHPTGSVSGTVVSNLHQDVSLNTATETLAQHGPSTQPTSKIFSSRVRLLGRETLTLDFKVSLAGEIVALPHDAGVPSAVPDLRVLDDDGEDIVVVDERELGPFVALLAIRKNGDNVKEPFSRNFESKILKNVFLDLVLTYRNLDKKIEKPSYLILGRFRPKACVLK